MEAEINLELLRYQRLASLGRDLGGFVHNAAGPLNIILGYVQLLQSKYPDEKGLNKIWTAGTELNEELQTVSGYLEEVEYSLSKECDLNEMVLHKLELLQANSEFKHNIKSEAELADDLPKVAGIYGDIMICLDVILNNAIEAVQNESIKKVIIRSEPYKDANGEYVRIMVRDTGEGIEEGLLGRYFDMGYSGWNFEEERQGVGLALAAYIMEMSGGRISLENSCGCGAEACLYFPLRAGYAI